jgi:thiol:disulfide interchange protein DsbD
VLDIPRGERRQEPLTRLRGLLVLQAREGVQEAFRIDTVSATGESIKPSSFPSMVRQLLFAFLGGLILNLMPCVFPVLSMKAVSFADIARKSPWEVRAHGLVFTAGVLVCFAVIVAILLALRAGGAEIGWGFQLQSPVFVTLLAYLMFAVGLNLSGVFTIGTRLMGLGSGLAVHPGYLGTFATGVLATLVATPCTAPFMGVALGYALTQPWQVSLLIFEALGLGLAFPYLLLSLSPKLLRFLPKPGVWMERLKEFLAFPMYATAAWLVWVLTLQTGSAGILAALIGMILIALGAWSYQSTRMAGPRWHWVGRIGAVVAFAIALGLVRVPVVNDAGEVASASRQVGQGPAWEPFSRPRLVEIIAEGRPAFVNFTAAWCITCLANERVALSSPRLAALFEKRGIVYLKADWTRQDPEITRMLSSFGRSGVPLYVYYPPAGAEPVILPQILTEAVVLENLGVSLDAKMMEGMDP